MISRTLASGMGGSLSWPGEPCGDDGGAPRRPRRRACGGGCRGRAGRWRRARAGRGRRRPRPGRWCGRWRGGLPAAASASRPSAVSSSGGVGGARASRAGRGGRASGAGCAGRRGSWRSAPVWARSSMSIIRPGPSFTSQGSAAAASCASARRRRMSAASASTLAASCGLGEDGGDGGGHLLAEVGRAGDDAGAGQRQVLPGPGLLGLVAAEGGERGGDRAGAAGGAQPHVDLVEDALGGGGGEGRDQRLGEAGVVDGDRQRPAAVGGSPRPRRRR